MLKTKLPVIVLRNMILLPQGEIKLEIQEEQDKNIIYNAINEHNNYVLLVSPKYATNDEINKDELPKYSVIGKISSNFELPNGNIRLSLLGINRAYVYDYIDEDNIIKNAIIGPVKVDSYDEEKEEAKVRILKNCFQEYVSIIPTINNFLIAKINEENSLETITDIIVNVLPLKFEDKYRFVNEPNACSRADYLIQLLKKEKNIGFIERQIEDRLKVQMDEEQKG